MDGQKFQRTLRFGLSASALMCFAGGARAEDPPKGATGTYALSFVRGAGAEGCPSRQDLEREVSAKLGHSPFEVTGSKSIEILTERTPEGFRSVVSAIDRDGRLLGRRVLVGEESSCAPIFSATALAVALLIDPEAALSHDSRANEAVGRFEVEEPAPPPPPPPPSPPVPAQPLQQTLPVVQATPAPVPQARQTPEVFTGAELGVAFGLVPEPSPEVGIFVHGRPDPVWGFSLSSRYVLKQQTARSDAGAILDVSLTTFDAAVTLSAVDKPGFRLVPDAGLVAGALHVAVRGGDALDSSDQPFLALGFGVRAEVIVIGGFFVGARVGAIVPLLRPALSARGVPDDPLWLQPAFAGEVAFNAGYTFF